MGARTRRVSARVTDVQKQLRAWAQLRREKVPVSSLWSLRPTAHISIQDKLNSCLHNSVPAELFEILLRCERLGGIFLSFFLFSLHTFFTRVASALTSKSRPAG